MHKMFKILFINVLDHRIKFQHSYPHLGIGYLISYIRKEIPSVDCRVVDSGELKQYRSFKPDLVAISSVTQNFDKAKTIARQIKACNPSCLIVVGGIHVSQIPKSMDRSMDIGVIGEGELTFTNLVKHILNSKDFGKDLDAVDGLVFWREGELIKTKERDVIPQLDDIPHPARSLLPGRENQLLLTSRGCPYKCTFCASSHYWKKLRYFSPDYVLEEIRQIIRDYPVLNLTIYDDLFLFDKKRLREISTKIAKADYHKKINFWCNARANLIDRESIRYLKDMNLKGVSMGLESGSDRILKMIKSGEASVEINKRAIELCKSNGIFVHGSFMLGCPYESEADMLETYNFIKSSGIDKGDIIVATPLPGTNFWDCALKEKIVSTNMDWSRLACWNIDNLPTMKNLTLLTQEVSKKRFLEIFHTIFSILLFKRKSYDKKWQKEQGKQIRVQAFFSLMNFRKFIRNPIRGLRYTISFISNVPQRIFAAVRSRRD